MLAAVSGVRNGSGLRQPVFAADPAELYRWYVQWTQAEAAFRVKKSDLGLRPVFHQKAKRVQAHLGLGLPQRPKMMANVVPKNGSKKL